jgi:VanZ family protein
MRPVFFYKPLPPLQSDAGWRWWFNVWAPVIIAVAVICAESTDTFSAANTSGWLRPIVQGVFGVMSDSAWDLVHRIIRKSGHFAGYGTVGFTFLRAWLYTLAQRGVGTLRAWRVESSILAIFSTAIVASCDEFHQSFLPSRTGTPRDVLLDTTGATVFCLLVWLVCWSKRTPQLEALES